MEGTKPPGELSELTADPEGFVEAYTAEHKAGTKKHGKILNRITLPGALFVAVIALLPSLFLAVFDVQNFPFAGISMLIAVGVMLETMKQIDSQLMMRNYEGFLK